MFPPMCVEGAIPMGHIKTDVINSHFRVYPEQREFADAFIHTFDINYGTRLNAYNTHIFCFLLSPDKSLTTMFGFDDEILLVYSPFAKIEPRTIQAIEQAFTQQPFRSRANPLAFIILTESVDAYQWVEKYLVDHPQFRTPVILNKEELLNNKLSRWYVRNKLSQQLFTRDIFDYQLPLDSDMYFFGRGKIVDEFVDSARKAQNRGLFGLRKTGKTSLLFKVRRVLEESGIATVLYIDCKRHDIRSRRWDSLLTYLTERILTAFSKKSDMFRKLSPVERFERVIREIGGSKNICLIFDEIEYITPFAVLDTHWKVDFTNLWQILWSAQSEY